MQLPSTQYTHKMFYFSYLFHFLYKLINIYVIIYYHRYTYPILELYMDENLESKDQQAAVKLVIHFGYEHSK